MVLTKDELIAAFQKEVHILTHLISKVDPAKVQVESVIVWVTKQKFQPQAAQK